MVLDRAALGDAPAVELGLQFDLPLLLPRIDGEPARGELGKKVFLFLRTAEAMQLFGIADAAGVDADDVETLPDPLGQQRIEERQGRIRRAARAAGTVEQRSDAVRRVRGLAADDRHLDLRAIRFVIVQGGQERAALGLRLIGTGRPGDRAGRFGRSGRVRGVCGCLSAAGQQCGDHQAARHDCSAQHGNSCFEDDFAGCRAADGQGGAFKGASGLNTRGRRTSLLSRSAPGSPRWCRA